MRFDLWRNVSEIYREWNDQYFIDSKKKFKDTMFLIGEKGSGKTSIAQEYIKKRPGKTRYFSFSALDGKQGRQRFCAAFDLDQSVAGSWTEIGKAFHKKHGSKTLLILFDDAEEYSETVEFKEVVDKYINLRRIVVCWLKRDDPLANSYYGPNTIRIGVRYRTLGEYFKILPTYSRKDILRLFTLTDGILPILYELDESEPLESNVRRLLRYDSAFSTFLPELLSESFRSPESYFPIIASIANGKHRLSEIAKDTGYPNNKCLTYLNALKNARIVIENRTQNNNRASYELRYTYYKAWGRYVYGNKAMQVSDPEQLVSMVIEDIDKGLALQTFQRACYRYLQYSTKDILRVQRFQRDPRVLRDVEVIKGEGLKLTYCEIAEGQSLFTIIPNDLERRYTKEDLANIRETVLQLPGGYENQILLFSMHRFNDWIVHQAHLDDELHLVTIERLKY